MLTGEQIRAARALARMEQSALAEAAGISLPTIKRLEKMVGPISANTGTEAALREAFSRAGVIFIEENGEGPGVRLRKMDRGEVHASFEQLVENLAAGRPIDPAATVVLDHIRRSPRLGHDLLPGRVAELVGELDAAEGRVPGTYGEAVARVERALPAAIRAGSDQ